MRTVFIQAMIVVAFALVALTQLYVVGCWRRPLVGQERTYYDVLDLIYPGEHAHAEFRLHVPDSWVPSDATTHEAIVSGQAVYYVGPTAGLRGLWLRTRYLTLVAPFESDSDVVKGAR